MKRAVSSAEPVLASGAADVDGHHVFQHLGGINWIVAVWRPEALHTNQCRSFCAFVCFCVLVLGNLGSCALSVCSSV